MFRPLLQMVEEKLWSAFVTAVYIAADSNNAVRYVGSAVRSGLAGVDDRIQEHARTGRAARWIRLMVVPLIPDTDASLVRRIEGRVRAVLQPVDTIRLPAFGRGKSPPAFRRGKRPAGFSTPR